MHLHYLKFLMIILWSTIVNNSVYGFTVRTSLPTTKTKPTLSNLGGATIATSASSKEISSSPPTLTSLHMAIDFNLLSSSSIPTIVTVAAATSGLIYLSSSIYKDSEKQRQYAEYEAKEKAMKEERARKAYIEPKEFWKEEELKQYDGTQDPEGPILMAVNGKVFNVYKGRHFYGPGCEYHIFAGRDATRLLAKTKLDEETGEEKIKDLTMAERATLQGWLWTFESKYEVVGKLEGFDERSTSTRTKL